MDPEQAPIQYIYTGTDLDTLVICGLAVALVLLVGDWISGAVKAETERKRRGG